MKLVQTIQSNLPYYKRILRIASPVILANAGQVTVMQIDNAMVGHYAEEGNELAAASFANSIYLFFMVFVLGLSIAITPIVGDLWKRKRRKESSAILFNASILILCSSVVVVLIMLITSQFFDYFGQNEEVVALAKPYFYILTASIIPQMLFSSFKQFLEGVNNTMLAMIVTLLVNIINIALNYAFIFGHWGFDAMGLNGAGFATLIARSCMPILLILMMYKKDQFRPYLEMLSHCKVSVRRMRKIANTGLPISFQIVPEVAAFGLSSIMIGWIGVKQQSAHQIAIGLISITFMVSSGIAAGATIRVSHQRSMRDGFQLRKAALAAIHLTTAFMAICSLLFICFRFQLASCFSLDKEVISYASGFLIWGALFQLVDGLNVATLGILRGMSDVQKAMKYALLTFLVIFPLVSLGGMYGFYFDTEKTWLGADGVWLGFTVSLTIASTLYLLRYRNIYRQEFGNH